MSDPSLDCHVLLVGDGSSSPVARRGVSGDRSLLLRPSLRRDGLGLRLLFGLPVGLASRADMGWSGIIGLSLDEPPFESSGDEGND